MSSVTGFRSRWGVALRFAGLLGFGLGSVSGPCGCGADPFANIAAGEGLQVTGPRPLHWEYGVYPHGEYGAPAYAPVGAKVVATLDEPWKPRSFPVQAGRCYAVELRVGTGGAGDDGPLTPAVRRAHPELVLRAPNGDVLATLGDSDMGLARCNWEGHPALTIDLAATPPFTGVLGRGRLEVQLHERLMTNDERWELDARTMPFLATGHILLRDPEHVRKSKGIHEKRDLEKFEPVDLGGLGPAECVGVTVTAAPDAHPNPEARTFDAPFVLVAERPTGIPAEEVVDGVLVAKEICNPGADPLPLSLVLRPRAGAPPPGTGTVTIEAFARPIVLLAAKTKFLAGGVLSPMSGDTYEPVGAPVVRRLESFEPVPIAVPSGECDAVQVKALAGSAIDKTATMDTHYFVFRDGRSKHRVLAQWDEKDTMVTRQLCNESLGEPWPYSLELVSRKGDPPGKGPVEVQVLRKQQKKKADH